MPLKSRPSQQKRLASVLARTLKELEASTDPADPSFVAMKSQIVQRIIQLEVDSTRARASIHLVEEPESVAPEDSAADITAQLA